MLLAYRRYWAVYLMILLTVPLLTGIEFPNGVMLPPSDNRTLASFPKRPETSAEWLAFPISLTNYLRDHFGLRNELIFVHSELTGSVLASGNGKVLVGDDGALFYREENMLEQSAGLLFRADRINTSAQIIAKVAVAARARGIKFLYAPPPNSSSIYPERLPRWAQNPGVKTEYDAMLSALSTRGILAVDLRPPLLRGKKDGVIYYRYDTHWTPRGALAAFNAIAIADGHANWVLDEEHALSPATEFKGGDLARMLSLSEAVSERIEPLSLASGEIRRISDPPSATFEAHMQNPRGLTIMVIGDSFTQSLFAPMALAHVARFVWTHHLGCGFEWKWIDLFHPDEIWWMPTERAIVCVNTPKGSP